MQYMNPMIHSPNIHVLIHNYSITVPIDEDEEVLGVIGVDEGSEKGQ